MRAMIGVTRQVAKVAGTGRLRADCAAACLALASVTPTQTEARAAETAREVVALLASGQITPALAAQRLQDLGPAAVPPLVAALETDSSAARSGIVVVLRSLGHLDDAVVDQAIAALAPGKRAAAHFELAEAARAESMTTFFGEPSPQPDFSPLYRRAAVHHFERALEMGAGTDAEQQTLQIRCLKRLLELYRKLEDPKAGDKTALRLVEGYAPREDAIVAAALYRADTGQMAEAERLLRAEVKRSQHGSEACNALANVLSSAGWPGGSARKADGIAVLAECADAHPAEAERHYRLAVYCWDWAYRDRSLDSHLRRNLAESGLRAIDRALAQSPENPDALIYKGLLFKVKAEQLPEGPQRRALLDQAEALRTQALAIKRRGQARGEE